MASITTNMASLYAQRNLGKVQSSMPTAVERLSSGLRINRAKDDAAARGTEIDCGGIKGGRHRRPRGMDS